MLSYIYSFINELVDWCKNNKRIYFPNMFPNKLVAIKAPATFEELKKVYCHKLNPAHGFELNRSICFYVIDKVSKEQGIPEHMVWNEETYQGLVFQIENSLAFVTVEKVQRY